MLTLAQAAEKLGLSVNTMRHQAATRRIRATKLGPLWVVDEAEVERYRREQQGNIGRPQGSKNKPRA